MSPLSCVFSHTFFVLWLFSYCAPFFVLKATVLVNVAPPKHVCLVVNLFMFPPSLSCGFSLNVACSRNLPPLSSLFCGFSLNVAPLLCLVAFLFIVAPLFVLPLFYVAPCGFSLNVAPLFYLVAVLLMLPPSFLVPVLVVCPPCLAAFLLMLLSLAIW